MKIKAINYMLHCPCGKSTIQTIKRRITQIETKCPYCKEIKILTVIGTVEYFGDHSEYSKVHYKLKPIKQTDGSWKYVSPESLNVQNNNNLTWFDKEKLWESDDALMKEAEKSEEIIGV